MPRPRRLAAFSALLAVVAATAAAVVPSLATANVDGEGVAAARRELAAFVAANPIGESGESAAAPCRLATPEDTATALGLDPIDPAAWLAVVRNDAVLRSGGGARIPVVTCAAEGRSVGLFAFESADLDFGTVAARFDVGNVMPTTPRQLGGQAAGRCVTLDSTTGCTVVWMRDGLVVGVRFGTDDPGVARQVTSRGLAAIAPVVVDTLVVGLPTTTTTVPPTTVPPTDPPPTTGPPTSPPPTDPPVTDPPPTSPPPTDPPVTDPPPTSPPPTDPPVTDPPPTGPPPTDPPVTDPPPTDPPVTDPPDPTAVPPLDVIAGLPEATMFHALVEALVPDPDAPIPDIRALLLGLDPAHPQITVFVPTDEVLAALPEFAAIAGDPVLARQFVLDLIVDGARPPDHLFSGDVGELTSLGGRLLAVDPAVPAVGGAPVSHVAPSLAAGDVYLAAAPVVAVDPPVPTVPPTDPPPTDPPPTDPPPTDPPPTDPPPTDPPPTDPPPTDPPPTDPPPTDPPPTDPPPTDPPPTDPPPTDPPPTDPPETTPPPTEPPPVTEPTVPLGTWPADPATATPYDVLAALPETSELRALIDALVVDSDPAAAVPDIKATLQGLDMVHPLVSIVAPTNDVLLALDEWPAIVADPQRAREFVLGLLVDGVQPPGAVFGEAGPPYLTMLDGRVAVVDRAATTIGAAPVLHVEPSLHLGDVYLAAAVPVLDPPPPPPDDAPADDGAADEAATTTTG